MLGSVLVVIRNFTLAYACSASLQARPERDLPRRCPAGAAIAAQFERLLRRRGKLGVALEADAVSRVQRVQMRHVPVGRLRLGIVLDPLLQLPARADLQRRQALGRPSQLGAELGVHAECLGRPPAVLEQLANELDVHRGRVRQMRPLAVEDVLVLGRRRRDS